MHPELGSTTPVLKPSLQMSLSPNEEVAKIVQAYDRGTICQGEVINQAIDLAADFEIPEILDLLPAPFRDLFRERGESMQPPRGDSDHRWVRGSAKVYEYFKH